MNLHKISSNGSLDLSCEQHYILSSQAALSQRVKRQAANVLTGPPQELRTKRPVVDGVMDFGSWLYEFNYAPRRTARVISITTVLLTTTVTEADCQWDQTVALLGGPKSIPVPPSQLVEPICVEPPQQCGVNPHFDSRFLTRWLWKYTGLNEGRHCAKIATR